MIISTTIPNGQAVSGVIDLRNLPVKGPISALIMPAVWTTADITLQGAMDGSITPVNVYDAAGNEYTITSPGASRLIILDRYALVTMHMIILRSGTSGSPVNQGQDTVIQVVIE